MHTHKHYCIGNESFKKYIEVEEVQGRAKWEIASNTHAIWGHPKQWTASSWDSE